jgi:toxin YoeB
MKPIFSENAWREYTELQSQDIKTVRRINELIKSILRDGFGEGIGKPEPLKHKKSWSRRIDDFNRLVYIGNENRDLEILACRGHYDK